jgi:hypothetical protein
MAAAVYLGKEIWQWKRAQRGGDMKHLTVRHPFWLLGLIGGCLLTAGIGFWFVFHPPSRIEVASIPSSNIKTVEMPNTIPAIRVPKDKPISKPRSTPLPDKEATGPLNEPTKSAPTAPSGQPTFNIQGNSGNIAGINNGQQIFNQFGPPKRRIGDKYINDILPILKNNPGEASIMSNSNSDELTQQLYRLFIDAQWKPIEIGQIMGGEALPDGVQIQYRGPIGIPGQRVNIPEDRPDVRAIVYGLSNSGIKGLTAFTKPDIPEHKIIIHVGGAVQ